MSDPTCLFIMWKLNKTNKDMSSIEPCTCIYVSHGMSPLTEPVPGSADKPPHTKINVFLYKIPSFAELQWGDSYSFKYLSHNSKYKQPLTLFHLLLRQERHLSSHVQALSTFRNFMLLYTSAPLKSILQLKLVVHMSH